MAIEIVTYNGIHFYGIDALWQEAFPDDPPWNAASISIPAKLICQPELFLVALNAGSVVGSVMAGYTGHRGWLDRVAVLKSHRRQHVGTKLIREAEGRLHAMGCIKVNLQVRASNIATTEFYGRVGYSIEERVSMSKMLKLDS
jgi:ribosomal protein S18 acetylase RimI-like enzyme